MYFECDELHNKHHLFSRRAKSSLAPALANAHALPYLLLQTLLTQFFTKSRY